MNVNELRKKDVEQLRKELHGLMREQFNLRMQQGMGQAGRPDQFKKVRRNIARVKTIMNEKQRAGGDR
jgi:large subunit ribosomal protein L29